MKNKLIPLTPHSTTDGEMVPALIPDGFKFRSLVGGRATRGDGQGFVWRPDLIGLVHGCGGLPIIQLDDGGVFAVQNADQFVVLCWGSAAL